MKQIRWLLAIPVALTLLSAPAGAEAVLPQPAGTVILTLSGPLSVTNSSTEAQFDLAMLDSLPQRETVTTTPWHEGVQTFSGPLLSDLMAAVGATGSQLRVVAVNDYAATIPWSDIESWPVILASRHNGRPMRLRDQGPLFVIYPFDEFPALRSEVHFARSVWQIAAIEILP